MGMDRFGTLLYGIGEAAKRGWPVLMKDKNKTAILLAAAGPGPYIYSVQADRIFRRYP